MRERASQLGLCSSSVTNGLPLGKVGSFVEQHVPLLCWIRAFLVLGPVQTGPDSRQRAHTYENDVVDTDDSICIVINQDRGMFITFLVGHSSPKATAVSVSFFLSLVKGE
jgi:hypothetical protein